MLGRQNGGLDDWQDTVVNIVGTDLTGNALFTDLVPSGSDMFVKNGYEPKLAIELLAVSLVVILREGNGQLSGSKGGASLISLSCLVFVRIDACELFERGREVWDGGRMIEA